MPTSAARPCAKPGCSRLIRGRGRYCEEHQKAETSAYDRERGSAAARGYGARWRRLRAMVLASNPLCADPFGEHARNHEVVAATDVDHIIALVRGGTNELSNLQALCHACHSRKTVLEDGGLSGDGRGRVISGDVAQ